MFHIKRYKLHVPTISTMNGIVFRFQGWWLWNARINSRMPNSIRANIATGNIEAIEVGNKMRAQLTVYHIPSTQTIVFLFISLLKFIAVWHASELGRCYKCVLIYAFQTWKRLRQNVSFGFFFYLRWNLTVDSLFSAFVRWIKLSSDEFESFDWNEFHDENNAQEKTTENNEENSKWIGEMEMERER